MNIVNRVEELEWHPTKRWATRALTRITQIIVHQELGNGSVEDVNRYHITPGDSNHISKEGIPHFAYHYGIERDGLIITANELKHITWHTSGQNTKSVGIMLVGNFDGPGYNGSNEPTNEQLISLENLIDNLCSILPNISKHNIFGHCDFGKPACPGYKVMEFIQDYKT